jgi:quinoprotein glucose dehydrogenase
LPPRDKEIAADAFRTALGGIVAGPTKVRTEAATVAAKLGIKEFAPALLKLFRDSDQPIAARIAGLKGLEALKDKNLAKVIELALADPEPKVRAEALRLFVLEFPDKALPELQKSVYKGAIPEKQQALILLGNYKEPAADAVLLDHLNMLVMGKLDAELQLELLEAAAKRNHIAIKGQLTKYKMTLPKDDVLALYREALHGGDADVGKQIFLEKSEVSCVRCHKLNGVGGEVGPDLTHIGKDQKREYLLESIVAPSKQFAKGYESVTLALNNGQFKTGILKSEDTKQVTLMTAEGTLVSVPKSDIDQRLKGKSAMPEDIIQKLSKSELRDLVEFLASLR